jgi:hypothetical protein
LPSTRLAFRLTILCLFLFPFENSLVWFANAGSYGRPKLSASELDSLERDLQDPNKRLPAIATLADFGSPKLYQVGSVIVSISGDDRETVALRSRATQLATLAADSETVAAALESDDPRLQMWALWFWRHGIYEAVRAKGESRLRLRMESLTPEEKSWIDLTPSVRRLAATSPHRTVAIDDLAAFTLPENRQFLKDLIPAEKSADVILDLLERTTPRKKSDRSERDMLFNEQLLRLLSDPDPKVRGESLGCIGLNWNNAPMYQVHFSSAVADRVQELRRSDDSNEVRMANFAAEGLQKIGKIWTDRETTGR